MLRGLLPVSLVFLGCLTTATVARAQVDRSEIGNPVNVPNLRPGDIPKPFRFLPIELVPRIVDAAVFAPDGSRVAIGGRDGSFLLIDLGTGRRIRTLIEPTHPDEPDSGADPAELRPNDRGRISPDRTPIAAIAFSHDGRLIASGGPRLRKSGTRFEGGTVRVWEIASGQRLVAFDEHESSVTGLAFSRNDDRIVSVDLNDKVKMWRIDSGREMISLGAGALTAQRAMTNPNRNALSGDALRVASTIQDARIDPRSPPVSTLKFWDLGTGRFRAIGTDRRFGGTGLSVALSQDGTKVAVGFSDRVLRVLDFNTARVILETDAEVGESFRFLIMSTDGTRLITSGDDGVIRIRDASSGDIVQTIEGPRAQVRAAVLLADRLRVVSGGTIADGPLAVWEANRTGDHQLKNK